MTALLDRLPPVRGTLSAGRPMAELSWLRVGGPAEILFQSADTADLLGFLAALPGDVPLLPVGLCSNLIIRDGGIPGVVLRLGRAFGGVEVLPGARLRAGAAAPDARVAVLAAEAGIAGLEFLRTIPGSIGGAVAMNAGCYGTYMADVVEEVTVATPEGLRRLGPAGIGFSYRASALPARAVVVEAVLAGRPDAPAAVAARMEEAMARRAASQPVQERSCGSTFRNPAGYSSTGRPDDRHDLKAWKLIEDAGCRGLARGGAQISEMHANFLINRGGATAADLEGLGEEVRERVFKATGISLEWEIMRVGRASAPQPR